MGKDSKIAWTDHTWNPWVGCSKVSAGCENCYMFRDAKRYGNDPAEIRRTKKLRFPLQIKEPSKIFVCSWSDFFHEDVPEDWRRDAWEIMFHAKNLGHQFLLLTKRPENIKDMLPVGWIESKAKYWQNIWLGVTAENQEMADLRIPYLLDIPAKVKFVSIEPMIGEINLWGNESGLVGSPEWNGELTFIEELDWVIVGGESGIHCRLMKEDWVMYLRDQCKEIGVPFFMKQWWGVTKYSREAIPDGLMIREFPE